MRDGERDIRVVLRESHRRPPRIENDESTRPSPLVQHGIGIVLKNELNVVAAREELEHPEKIKISKADERQEF